MSVWLGMGVVALGQLGVLLYYTWRKRRVCETFHDKVYPIQLHELWHHVFQPESFTLVFVYLWLSWHFHWMPSSYYDTHKSWSTVEILMQCLSVDFWMFWAHIGEHAWSWWFCHSHAHHHIFVKPRLLQAFQGCVLDTCSLIILPLAVTAKLITASYWSYVGFGLLYSSYFTLIHAEFPHPWDPYLSRCGFMVTSDHFMHHKHFRYNFGHMFTFWDRLWGSYRAWKENA